MPERQKKAPDLITDGCKPLCCCWELNSGPLEEQSEYLNLRAISPALFLFCLFVSFLRQGFSVYQADLELTW